MCKFKVLTFLAQQQHLFPQLISRGCRNAGAEQINVLHLIAHSLSHLGLVQKRLFSGNTRMTNQAIMTMVGSCRDTCKKCKQILEYSLHKSFSDYCSSCKCRLEAPDSSFQSTTWFCIYSSYRRRFSVFVASHSICEKCIHRLLALFYAYLGTTPMIATVFLSL